MAESPTNIMRAQFKKMAENYSSELQLHFGKLFDGVWEIVQTCSRVTDRCLQTNQAINDEKHLCLLYIIRNSLSDCCCCLDSAERGQDRTVHNNLRMILEDICCVIHSTEDDKTLERLYNGKHQASNSVGFAKNHYSTHEIGQLYGILSKISHHSMQELIVRQWVNRDGLPSHLKPFNPERSQATLNILLLVIYLSRIAGEVAEKVCIKELDKPYFWESPQTKRENPPIDTLIHDLCEKISVLMNQNSDQVTEPTANV